MKNKVKSIILIIVFLIFGTILGFISEYALIYDLTTIVKITQNPIFWAIIMIIPSIFTKSYKMASICSIISMIAMNTSYYIIRLLKFGFTNTAHWNLYILLGISGSIYLNRIIYFIKEKAKKQKISLDAKNSFIFMTIFFILFQLIDYICMWTNIFNPFSIFYSLFGHMLFMISGPIGILTGLIIYKVLNIFKLIKNTRKE